MAKSERFTSVMTVSRQASAPENPSRSPIVVDEKIYLSNVFRNTCHPDAFFRENE